MCYNRFPDEKGTERDLIAEGDVEAVGYNRFPDEKGTERSVDRAPSQPVFGLQPFPR